MNKYKVTFSIDYTVEAETSALAVIKAKNDFVHLLTSKSKPLYSFFSHSIDKITSICCMCGSKFDKPSTLHVNICKDCLEGIDYV